LHMREYAKARPLLERRLNHVRSGGSSQLEEFEARRDLLFVDVYSSAITVEESGLALKTLYEKLASSHLDAPRLKADILGALFWAAARSFNPQLAESTIVEIRDLHHSYDQPDVKCRTARSLGIYECYKGRLDKAEALLTAALEWAKETGEEPAIVNCYIGLSALLFRVMRSNLAEQILEEALPLAEQVADPARTAAILCNCAVPYMYLQDDERAEHLLNRALRTLETCGDTPDTSPSILYNLGFVAYRRGDLETAEARWSQALHVSTQEGVVPIQEECFAALGHICLRRRRVAQARAFAARALRLARRGAFLVDERFGLEELLARLRYEAGRPEKALKRLAQIASSSRENDIPLYLTAQLTRLELLVKMKKNGEASIVREALSDVASVRGATWWVEKAACIGNAH